MGGGRDNKFMSDIQYGGSTGVQPHERSLTMHKAPQRVVVSVHWSGRLNT